MKTHALYLECYSGISGDMTVGALLDLGADFSYLKSQLSKLPLEGYRLTFDRIMKKGIQAGAFRVYLEEEPADTWEEYEKEDRHHGTHHHGGDGLHEHSHAHSHRRYSDIKAMLEGSKLDPGVKERALRVFAVLAEAEAKVHGRSVGEVAFHEVGAVDSIVDIVGAAACLESLGVEKVYYSKLYEGQGQIHCQHGWIPVPVPAVMELAAAHGLPLRITENQGEMITPTGAALVSALGEPMEHMEDWRMVKVGMGAGEREFVQANVLRAVLLEQREALRGRESVWVLESNVDDCSGEQLGYAIARLMEAGARDASCLPLLMKKGRPGYLLMVICDQERIEALEDILFRETSAIGLRKYQEERTVLPREMGEVSLPEGRVRVKICYRKGDVYCYPEYEDVKQIARETSRPFKEIYDLAVEAAAREQG